MGLPKDIPRIKGHIENLNDQKFGQLAPVKFIETRKGIAYWLCKCDCGNEVIKAAKLLKNGHTTTCGDLNAHPRKHGKSNTRLFSIWQDMKNRCKNPNIKNYKNYGERGIRVCDEWINSFEMFWNWAVNNGYQQNLTIDRINSNGNYNPENCRWADDITQSNNKRVCNYITINGVTKTATEWGRENGISGKLVMQRMKAGWPQDELFSPVTPTRRKHKRRH
jgi:hypothetical protein